jgi:hypothetical protein
MWEFFRGWRRKAGCIVLAIALALLALWGRSTVLEDSWIWFDKVPEATYILASKNHEILWARQASIYQPPPLAGWYSGKPRSVPFFRVEEYGTQSRQRWFGVRFEKGETKLESGEDEEDKFFAILSLEVRAVSYWTLVTPLTLLSACLILWKPRTKPKEHHHA